MVTPPAKTFNNAKRIDVPEEYKPLNGYVIVPVILSPLQFHEFWSKVRAQDKEPEDGHHSILATYETRVPLVREAHLFIEESPIPLPANGMDLADQAIAPFIVAATQECVNRATRIPTLPVPSKNGTA